MRFEFVVRSGKEVGRTVAVNSGQTISLGRLKGCDVVVDDEAASRRHCTITAREDVCVASDLQSANGTFVGAAGAPLPTDPIAPGSRRELGDGDRVYVGAWTRIVVRDATAEEQSL